MRPQTGMERRVWATAFGAAAFHWTRVEGFTGNAALDAAVEDANKALILYRLYVDRKDAK